VNQLPWFKKSNLSNRGHEPYHAVCSPKIMGFTYQAALTSKMYSEFISNNYQYKLHH